MFVIHVAQSTKLALNPFQKSLFPTLFFIGFGMAVGTVFALANIFQIEALLEVSEGVEALWRGERELTQIVNVAWYCLGICCVW